jgi:hypothetical protein
MKWFSFKNLFKGSFTRAIFACDFCVRFLRAIFACDFHVRLSHCVLAVCVCLGPEILADSDFDFIENACLNRTFKWTREQPLARKKLLRKQRTFRLKTLGLCYQCSP